MSQIIPMSELSAMDEAFHVQLLPGGMCIVNPTENEKRLLDIYAEEIERLRTSERAIAE